MSHRKPFLILFPGGWGHQTPELVQWWFRHVITSFQAEYQIIAIVYKGNSLDAYIQESLDQLRNIPDGSKAICYSMGAQIARGVAQKRPMLFRKVALISGLEYFGIRLRVVLSGLCIGIIPFMRILIGQPLKFDTVQQCKRVFFTGKDEHTPDKSIQTFMEKWIYPEPAWATIQLTVPLLRKQMKPFSCPILVIVPKDDFFARLATYPGENVQRMDVTGNHGILCAKNNRLKIPFNRITEWFHS